MQAICRTKSSRRVACRDAEEQPEADQNLPDAVGDWATVDDLQGSEPDEDDGERPTQEPYALLLQEEHDHAVDAAVHGDDSAALALLQQREEPKHARTNVEVRSHSFFLSQA
ncbi:MAG: hypothetical protein GEU75_17575 [Dehalococcoidia bacterium]|nr:hypothetical protein [Dehalococcoidia bacterium]